MLSIDLSQPNSGDVPSQTITFNVAIGATPNKSNFYVLFNKSGSNKTIFLMDDEDHTEYAEFELECQEFDESNEETVSYDSLKAIP